MGDTSSVSNTRVVCVLIGKSWRSINRRNVIDSNLSLPLYRSDRHPSISLIRIINTDAAAEDEHDANEDCQRKLHSFLRDLDLCVGLRAVENIGILGSDYPSPLRSRGDLTNPAGTKIEAPRGEVWGGGVPFPTGEGSGEGA